MGKAGSKDGKWEPRELWTVDILALHVEQARKCSSSVAFATESAPAAWAGADGEEGIGRPGHWASGRSCAALAPRRMQTT